MVFCHADNNFLSPLQTRTYKVLRQIDGFSAAARPTMLIIRCIHCAIFVQLHNAQKQGVTGKLGMDVGARAVASPRLPARAVEIDARIR